VIPAQHGDRVVVAKPIDGELPAAAADDATDATLKMAIKIGPRRQPVAASPEIAADDCV